MIKDTTILGIDPGTNILGFGVIRVENGKPHYLEMGVIDLRKEKDAYSKLSRIFREIGDVCDRFSPDEMALESPFYGKNAQVVLKLGRAQGVAIAAAIHHDVPIHEYAPLKIKMAITGQGQASKEQVAAMLQRMLNIREDEMPKYMDATDALGAAYCHFLQMGRPETGDKHYSSWKDFATKNASRIEKGTGMTGPQAKLLAAINRTTHK